MFLSRFQDGCDKDLASNELTSVKVERIPMAKEAEVPTISVIPDKTSDLEKGYYHGVYVLIQFNKEIIVDRNDYQVDTEAYPYEKDMEDGRLNDEREHHWRMVFEDNKGGVDNKKAIIHGTRWDVYMNDKRSLIKGGIMWKYQVMMGGCFFRNS